PIPRSRLSCWMPSKRRNCRQVLEDHLRVRDELAIVAVLVGVARTRTAAVHAADVFTASGHQVSASVDVHVGIAEDRFRLTERKFTRERECALLDAQNAA